MNGPTPSQTIGPFFAFGMRWLETADLVRPEHPRAIRIEGSVLDGDGIAVPDALLEVFQADAAGQFGAGSEPGWRGFGRVLASANGQFAFTTVKPGRVCELAGGGAGDVVAPHIDVSVFARGLLQRVVTRIYFPDEEAANASDPVLRTVPADRRPTLVARADGGRLRFDVHLQGEAETVFFNC